MTKSLSFQPLAGLGIHLGMGVGSKGPVILNQSGNHNKSADQGVSHSPSDPSADLSLEVMTRLGMLWFAPAEPHQRQRSWAERQTHQSNLEGIPGSAGKRHLLLSQKRPQRAEKQQDVNQSRQSQVNLIINNNDKIANAYRKLTLCWTLS